MQEVGYCNGIENYSAPIDGRGRGEPPNTLLDFFPDDFLVVIDESHVSGAAAARPVRGRPLPQGARSSSTGSGCRRRPTTGRCGSRSSCERVEPGRVPVGHARAPTSASCRRQVVEQVVRPDRAGRPRGDRQADQGPDRRPDRSRSTTGSTAGDRVLVTTLTKKMAEDLTDYLLELGVRVRYLHSEVDTIQRIEILRDLRLGEFDVLVGINLLREGLDLPEVSLVAILDADKEGFLRSETSLIQTIGRAARNVDGQVIMYADKVTDSMQRAISETNRRRGLQQAVQPRARHRPADDPQGGHRHPRLPAPERDRRPCPGRTARRDRAIDAQAPRRPGRAAARGAGPAHPHPRGGDARGRRPICASSTRPASATRSRSCGAS